MGRYSDVSQEGLRASWHQRQGSEKRRKTAENSPQTSETALNGHRPANVHRLFPKNRLTAKKPQITEPAPEPDVEARQTPAGQPEIATPEPSKPDWTEHPITKALEGFNMGLFGANPAQIIADSLNIPFARTPIVTPNEPPAPNQPAISPDTHDQADTADFFEEMPLRPIETDAPEFVEQDVETHGEGAAYEAFWNVWLGHQDYLRGQCIRMMSGNMADAEDALSNAMLRASQKFEAYSDSIVNERAWLSKLVYNVCIDHFRREQRTESRPFDQEQGMQVVDTLYTDPQQSPEEIALCQEQLDQLHQSMSLLSDNLRVPLFLRCVEGWSYPEIAERLHLRTDTVRKRIQLARDQLKRAGIR